MRTDGKTRNLKNFERNPQYGIIHFTSNFSEKKYQETRNINLHVYQILARLKKK